MKRIAIDARSRGSTGRYSDRLIKYLQKIDKDNHYYILIEPEQQLKLSAGNFEAIEIDAKDYSFSEQIKLWWRLRCLRPDLVHFTMPQQPLLCRGKSVTTIHDLTMLRFHNITGNRLVYFLKLFVYRTLLFIVGRKSEAIITPSKFVKLDVIKTLKADPIKIAITYEAADHIGIKPEPVQQLEGKKFLLYSGNVFPHKNVGRLLDAFSLIKSRHPNLHLAIAGKLNDYGNSLAKTAGDNVHFLGYVSDNELLWLYKNAFAYVYPSLSEGFGLPGLEAMRYGLPLLSSNATCLPEIYGEAALYFDPKKSAAIAEAIEQILKDKRLREDLVAKGRKRLRQFSWKKMAEETLAVYDKVLPNNR